MDNKPYYQQGGFNNYMNYANTLSPLSPFYKPNSAFNMGLAYGTDAPLGAKIGTTIDAFTQSLLNLNNRLQPFIKQPQAQSTPQRESNRLEGARSNTMQDGGVQDPNQFDLATQPQQPYLYGQPQLPNEIIPLPIQNNTNPLREGEEPRQQVTNQNNLGAFNAIGMAGAIGSFTMDLGKNIAGGIGVGRRSMYNYDRAQERMRDATINQGFEKGQQDLFNQGYMQTTGLMAQDGGQIPTSQNGLYEYPNQEVRVPSNNITMQGIPYDVLANPNNDPSMVMRPNQNYQFPNSKEVIEQPLIKLEDGLYFNPTTQEFIQE